MTVPLNQTTKPIKLHDEETEIAKASSEALAELVQRNEHPITLCLRDDIAGTQIETTVPGAALRLLANALARMARGESIALTSSDAELTTQQAADMMGVSRPYLVGLLEKGDIPYRKVGKHRRIRLESLRRYIETYQQRAAQALDEMSEDAQKMGLYE